MNGVAQKVAEFFGGNLAGFAIDAYGNVYLSGQPNWPDSNQATPKITWNNPANITFGTPLTATQLDATASVAGTFAYTLSDGVTSAEGAILNAGQGQTLDYTFTPTDTVDYSSVTGSVLINVLPATPTFSSLNSPTIVYGTTTATVSGRLSANAGAQMVPEGENVQITLNNVTQTATVVGAGDFSTTFDSTSLGAANSPYAISFSYAGDDNFNGATGSSTLAVNQASQSILFSTNSYANYGTAITLSASGGGSGNPVTFAVLSGPATLAGKTLTFTGVGSVVVIANEAGNANYAAATPVQQTIVVTSNTQSDAYVAYIDAYYCYQYANAAYTNGTGSYLTMNNAYSSFYFAFYAYYLSAAGQTAASETCAYYAYYYGYLAYYYAFTDYVGSGNASTGAYDAFYYGYYDWNNSYNVAIGN